MPLVIVHWKILVPKPIAVTVVLGEVGLVIVAVPDTNVHSPLPIVGVLALSDVLGFVIHRFWSAFALATVGTGSTKMRTVSADVGQVPLVITHLKIFVPTLNPVTADVGELGVVGVPVPETKYQNPLPIIGLLPMKAELDEQMYWSAPALATVGIGSTLMVIKSSEGAQVPFVIRHLKTFAPTLNPVTADVGEVGLVGTPVPETNVHNPLPMLGVLPDNMDDEAQIVWSTPALAVVGNGSTFIVT